MMRAAILTLICLAAQAQTFDVASVKSAAPLVPDGRGMIRFVGPTGGPGSKDPGRIHYPYMTLKNLLMNAYNVKSHQISGPPWINSERFDVDATMPPDTTKEQFRVMLQNLLVERFQLKLHHETKELPMYALILSKKSPKMKESATPAPQSAEDGPPPNMPLGPPKMGADGFPILPAQIQSRPGIYSMMMPNRARLVGQQQTMEDLANRLTMILDRPVSDATGLTAKYDFTLSYSPEGLSSPLGPLPPLPPRPPSDSGPGPGPTPDAEPPPDIFTAIQSDLGLKLDPKKGPVDLIVIDHVEKTPTAN
jgi:uncharacterized protein (TIGR03435 family)